MHNLRTVLVGILTSLLISAPHLSADDTDIYTGNPIVKGKSNILLSIDTSGSMRNHVINFDAVTAGVTSSIAGHPKYDPSINYNTSGCFDGYVYQTNEYSQGAIMPYVNWSPNSEDSNDINPPYYKCALDAFAVDGLTSVSTTSRGLWSRTGVFNGARRTRAYPSTNVACAQAQQSLNTVGYFYDENNVCSDGNNIEYDRLLLSGRFLDFVNSLVDTNGYPVDATGSPIPWENFFVESRLQIVKDVVNDIIANTEGFDINIGLMRFTNSNDGDGGLVAREVLPLLNKDGTENTTNTKSLSDTVADFVNYNGTPLEETYYEAYRYFRGEAPFYGGNNSPDNKSISSSLSGGNYKSPITHACQKNSIILLTDGAPSVDDGARDAIRKLHDNTFGGTSSCSGAGDCMDELAKVLSQTDIVANDTGLTGPDGNTLKKDSNIEQTVTTHTVGFFNDNKLLTDTADAGDGITRLASNSADLKAFFRDAISAVVEEATTFSAPSISVNSLNRFENLDDLYFSLFEPSNKPLWNGNIKKYELENSTLVDSNNVPAVDDTTGFFKDTAKSFWTLGTTPDGNEVTEGGFVSRLTSSRQVVSDIKSFNLSNSNGENDINTTNITPSDFGLDDSNSVDLATTSLYIDWLRGVTRDASDNELPTNTIGDTLHTTPLVITYNPTGAVLSDTDDADQALFFGTNAGFLHSIDVNPTATSDIEHFAYFPKDLLPNVPKLFTNQAVSDNLDKAYGLDGPLSYWIEGDNNDDIVNEGEKAHLYVTMRRGGNSIYALDVSDYKNPKLEWKIDNSSPGFEELGQTWSKVTPTKINYKGTQMNVLIFAGGYDENQDTATQRTIDKSGRAIYIVRADGDAAGSILWRATTSDASNSSNGDILELTDMKYSIPSDIAVSDVNADGFSDVLHVGDMGGQIWRFDILEKGITGGVIANLAGDTQSEHRRFFSAPSIARVSNDAYGNYLSVAIGSGARPDPKNTTTIDKLYMVKDPYILGPKLDSSSNPNYDYALNGEKIFDDSDETASLSDITNIAEPKLNEIGDYGWFIDLGGSGEKILNKALTADNKIFFNSYLPAGSNTTNTDPCDSTASIGISNTYAISLFDGSAVGFTDIDKPQTSDRLIDNSIRGIAPPAQLVITSNGGKPPPPVCDPSDPTCTPPSSLGPLTTSNSCPASPTATLVVGSRTLTSGICTAPKRTYWNRYETE